MTTQAVTERWHIVCKSAVGGVGRLSVRENIHEHICYNTNRLQQKHAAHHQQQENHPPRFLAEIGEIPPLNHKFWYSGRPGCGGNIHIDFHMTGFWNALILGKKRWVLVPWLMAEHIFKHARVGTEETVTADDVFGLGFEGSSGYFESGYTKMIEAFGIDSFYECNQEAGDVIISPSGYQHVVLWLQDSVALSHQIINRRSVQEYFWSLIAPGPGRRNTDGRFSSCLTPDEFSKIYGKNEPYADPEDKHISSNTEYKSKLDIYFYQALLMCTNLWSLDEQLYRGSACELLIHPKCTRRLEQMLQKENYALPLEYWKELNPFYNCTNKQVCVPHGP